MNPFTEPYKHFENSVLLNIISHPEGYQPLAIEAAKLEIANRNLSEKELGEANEEIKLKILEKEMQNEKKKQKQKKIINWLKAHLSFINPFQQNESTAVRLIKAISVFFIVYSIYSIGSSYRFLKFMFTDEAAEWGFIMVLFFIPLLWVPFATILFWMQKKIGWVLLTIYLTFEIGNAIAFLYTIIKMQLIESSPDYHHFWYISPIYIFFVAVFFVLCTPTIRKIYRIGVRTLLVTIGFTITALGIYIYTFI